MPVQELQLTMVTVDAIKQDLIDRIASDPRFSNWTDQRDSNNMIVLLEAISVVAEMNYAYINRMAREAFLLFALDSRNVIAHAKGLGYNPHYQTPSSVSAVIVSANPVADNSLIPAGTKFGSSIPGVSYETVDNVTILKGQSQSNAVTLKQQESWADDFIGTGMQNQQIQLNKTPVMPDSIQVLIDGVEWTYVNNFVDTDATSLVFTWIINSDGNANVVFGNGVNGKKPVLNASGRVFYKTGGGSAGSVGPNQLAQCLSVVVDPGNGNVLSLTAVNSAASSPGSDGETLDQIRKHAIANLIAPRVLLTRSDIENAVSSIAGILAVKAVNWEVLPSLPHYIVQVFVVPNGLEQPSDQTIVDVTNLLTQTKPIAMGHQVSVLGPTYVNLNFQLKVTPKPGFVSANVNVAVRQQLVDLFDPSKSNVWGFVPEFGMSLFSSQIIAVLQQVEGVRNLAVLAPGDLQLNINEYPVLGTINFV